MIGSIMHRVGYIRYVIRPGFWRWLVAAVDHVFEDHIAGWTAVRRGDRCTLHPTVSLRSARNIELGRDTRINQHCVLWASPNSKIRIGDHSGLGPGTQIYSSNHKYLPGVPYFEQPWNEKDVTIGRDVWVGGGCKIMPGVTIGDGCVLAAGSVVTRDLPPGTVAAGVPAKPIKMREAEAPAELPSPQPAAPAVPGPA